MVDAPDLDVAGVVVEDGGADAKLNVHGAGAATAFTGLVVTQFSCNVVGGGFVAKAEGFGCSIESAPGLEVFEGLVG